MLGRAGALLLAWAWRTCGATSPNASACSSLRFGGAIPPWTRTYAELRSEQRCEGQRIIATLGWGPLVAWWAQAEKRDALEPLLGTRSLLPICDGIVGYLGGQYRLRLAPAGVRPIREAAIVYFPGFGPGTTGRRNETEALAVALTAARRVVLIVGGDAAFPPRDLREFVTRNFVASWAANVAPDSTTRPFPLGVSTGPGDAWARTVSSHLAGGRSAGLAHRRALLECRGYRRDRARDAALDGVRAAGFSCDARDHASGAKYFIRLLSARTVLCPRGFGVATFRAYETLLAGGVPVLERFAPHDALWIGLPVIQVEDFRDLTPAKLQAAYDALLLRRNRLDLRAAFTPFWIKQVAASLGG
ncbi:hypothetical protein M885DRAFT_617321 [Pelagophyceae sp. CCMP2097]|nr:hypothetical protein M885DRAFT_617321 [Pelagophyceae sp. CCMP2097]